MSEEQPALEPIEVKEVSFYGDNITAALVKVNEKQQVYVPLRPICEYLGLAWNGQFERLKRDRVLSKKLISIRMTRTEIGRGKGSRAVVALDLDYVGGWLFGVDVSRVKPSLQEKLVLYQEFIYLAIRDAVMTTINNSFVVEPTDYQPSQALLEIEQMGLAIAEMARQQMESERRLNSRLDNAGRYIKQIERQFDSRIGELEAWRNALPDLITPKQAADISAAVKALAEHLASTLKTDVKIQYPRVFTQLNQRFAVTSYKELTKDQYPAVIKFLADWRNDKDRPKQGNLF